MLDRIAGGDWPVVLLDVVLLTLWGALPILLVAYVRQWLTMWQMRPEFCLRKSEAAELDRALAVYRDVCGRLAEIEAQGRTAKGILQLIFALQPDIEQRGDEEREDLNAHARHLRATIAKLRRLPLWRVRERIAALSLHAAVGGALAIHVATFAALVLVLHFLGMRAAVHELTGAGRDALVWYPFDASYFLANGAGAALGMLLAPAFYVLRRVGLVREYAMELAVLKELAETPAEVIADDRSGRVDDADESLRQESSRQGSWRVEPQTEDSCFAVLGVEQSATIEQIRAAYRTRIKESHPDRLAGMSAAIRTFAEDETKKLNAAFQEALERLA
jgi:DnaJ-like protein